MVVKIDQSNTTSVSKNNLDSNEAAFAKNRNEGKFLIRTGDSMIKLAKLFGVEDYKVFMQLIGRDPQKRTDEILSAGSTIDTLPSKVFKKNRYKYLYDFARSNDMTLKELCELNNIPYDADKNDVKKPFTYSDGDNFFVKYTKKQINDVVSISDKDKTTTSASTTATATTTTSTTSSSEPSSSNSTSSATNKVTSTYCVYANAVERNIDPKSTITIDNKVWTAEKLRKDAITSGKNAKEYKDIKNTVSIERPLPNIVNGKIEATTEIRMPTKANGDLKGKVVILNPGHGGYQNDNGYFDAGTCFTVDDGEGNIKPLEEWHVTRSYVDELATILTGKGATVVVVTGAVQKGGMYSQEFLQGLYNGKKGSLDVRRLMENTLKSNMLFLSIHVESAKENPDKLGISVITDKTVSSSDAVGDNKLAENIAEGVNILYKNSNNGFSSTNPEHNKSSIYVGKSSGSVPAALLELGNIANPSIKNTLLSKTDRAKYMNGVANAIVKTMTGK